VTRSFRRSFTITQRWTVEIKDILQVPRKYRKVDHAAIQAAIDNGVRTIPGVRIFNLGAELHDWYTQRVDQLLAGGQRSSDADDWHAAQQKFPRWARGDEVRDLVRALRRTYAPDAWKRKGRPPGAKNRLCATRVRNQK
jgi:hypothetical protein